MERYPVLVDLNEKSSYAMFLSASRQSVPILYEDNHLLIVVKPEGVLSQSDGSNAPDMLTLLKEYIKIRSSKPGDVFLGLVHRLDRPVSGVMVFSKTSKSASRISGQIRQKTVTKRYYAVVHGMPAQESGTLRSRLMKDSANIVREEEEGKEAVLHFRVLGTNAELKRSLLDITLETGRAHQIRVQLAGMGNPILGDKKYGDPAESYKGDIALFSYFLSFKHPTKDVEIEVRVIPYLKQAWRDFAPDFQAPPEHMKGNGYS